MATEMMHRYTFHHIERIVNTFSKIGLEEKCSSKLIQKVPKMVVHIALYQYYLTLQTHIKRRQNNRYRREDFNLSFQYAFCSINCLQVVKILMIRFEVSKYV